MKSQAFSMDLMIAFVIFLGTIFIFYSVINNSDQDKTGDLQDDASDVLENFVTRGSDVGILDGSKVNITKIEELLGQDYEDIKGKLRIENDFCIYFEDNEGNVIYLTPGQPGLGSDKINVSDIPCS